MVVAYATRVNGLTGLAVTKLDVLDTFAEIPVCVGYTRHGRPVEVFPSEVEALEGVEPVWETLPGWNAPTTGARRIADLPAAARAYLDRIEALSGAPIRYVSVGTHRDQIIAV
jgi:adenylosuccinate synthase